MFVDMRLQENAFKLKSGQTLQTNFQKNQNSFPGIYFELNSQMTNLIYQIEKYIGLPKHQ